MGRGNARVAPKGNTILITKQASGAAKIDPLKVAFSAIALLSTNPWSSRRAPSSSRYTSRV
jgi:phage terminase large subunit-like protein